MTRPRALPYYGGKQYWGRWIADQLPRGELYVEPYAGMLAVLLQREPVKLEIVNDLNGDVANWWRQVRDDPDGLARLVALTPRSKAHLAEAWETLGDESATPLRRAWATHVCIAQGMLSQTMRKPQWALVCNPSVGSPFRRWLPEDFALLAERMVSTQIHCGDAVKLLLRVAGEKGAVVYCDPPYRTARTEYRHNAVDVEATTAALKAQKGRVAISGYGDEWSHLGWRMEERDAVAWSSARRGRRVERLWLNFPADDLFAEPDA